MQGNKENFKLNSGAGPGAALPVDRYTFKSIHVKPDTGSYTLDVSNDGTNWVNFSTAITTETFLTTEDPTNPLPKAVNFMRIVTNSDGTAPFATLFGIDPA